MPKGKLIRPTVKEISCNVLCEIVGENKYGYTIGYTYEQCVAEVVKRRVEQRGESPEVAQETKHHSLRWYAKMIREDHEDFKPWHGKLPRIRPRKPHEVQNTGS